MDIRRTGLEMIRGDFLPRDQFRSQVWRRWTAETDPGIRLDLIACFGELLDHDSDDTATHTELHRLLDDPPDGPDPDPREGLAAQHALAGTDPGLPLTRIPQMIAAIRDPRASRWRDTARFAGAPQAIVAATARLLAADPVAHTTFTLAVGEDSGGEERVAVLGQVGRLLATWRHLDPLLIDFLIDRLGDSGAEVRYRAAQLLGCVPAPAAADALAVLAADTTVRDSRTGITVGDAAVWALSRLHDPRCVPWLQRRMPYPAHQTMTSSEVGPAFDLPSLEEVLAPLARFAADLTGAVSRLPDKPVMCAILGAWAVPDGIAHLTPLLTAPSPGLPPADPVLAGAAARALGEIGPAAARAAGLLRDHPWAYWRVTGDPAPLLAALPPSWDRQALRDLADLGPLARQAEARIRSLTTPKNDDGVRADAAWAHHRVTGDTSVAIPVLSELAATIEHTRALPVAVSALQRLAAIGAGASVAAPTAQRILDSPRRFHYFTGWHLFHTDERLRAAATTLLATVSRPRPPS